jgi:DNA-binding NarL/FixJ family response regulator
MRLLIRTVAQPDRWVMGNVVRVPRDTLTELERRTLEAMSRGLEREGAAELTGVSVEVVKDRLKVARRVLRAKNTTHACCEALRQGLIS